jgi:hypothetical protein
MGVEPMTCRLRIGCSTSKLRWRSEEPEDTSQQSVRQITVRLSAADPAFFLWKTSGLA